MGACREQFEVVKKNYNLEGKHIFSLSLARFLSFLMACNILMSSKIILFSHSLDDIMALASFFRFSLAMVMTRTLK
jgi:hypothetical protein